MRLYMWYPFEVILSRSTVKRRGGFAMRLKVRTGRTFNTPILLSFLSGEKKDSQVFYDYASLFVQSRLSDLTVMILTAWYFAEYCAISENPFDAWRTTYSSSFWLLNNLVIFFTSSSWTTKNFAIFKPLSVGYAYPLIGKEIWYPYQLFLSCKVF